jgi:uncharacterized protein (TIGR00255 family)
MTGFGQATAQAGACRITVEVRSVNQRFLDVKLNMPRDYHPWEKELRALVQAAVQRGKVDVNINRSGNDAAAVTVEINQPLARAYLRGLRELQTELLIGGDIELAMLANRPDVLRIVERRTDPTAEVAMVRRAVQRALQQFNQDRTREGRALATDLRRRVRHLAQIEARVRARAQRLRPLFFARLRERMQALLASASISEERLAQEAALLAEKSDVTEELVRLDSHLRAMSKALAGREPAGRQFDFLLQEIHREINTIASKSADLEITKLTLAARAEAEKIREQVQNVE